MSALLKLQRLAHRLHSAKVALAPRLIEGVIRVVWGAALPAAVALDESVVIEHGGLGLVLNFQSVVGKRVHFGVHVVLGGKGGPTGAPVIEDDVILMAGARIIGAVTVGQGSVVAANAVVTRDVPPRSMVAGVPAVVKKSGIVVGDYI